MTFASAVFWSIFFLLGAAVLGALIIYFMLRRRLMMLSREAKSLQKSQRTLQENLERNQKELNLEIMARDKKLSKAQENLDNAKAECEKSQADLRNLLQDQDKKYLVLKAEYDTLKSNATSVEADLRAVADDREKKISTMQAELDNIKLKLESSTPQPSASPEQHPAFIALKTEYGSYKAENEKVVSELRTSLDAKGRALEEAQRTIVDLQARIEHLEHAEVGKPDKKEAALAKLRERAKSFDYSRMGVAKADEKDDLKLIVGIGPFIEEKLNALGIFTFLQISKFTDEDVEKVTEAIEFFPGRIQRDKWIDQAVDFVKTPPTK
jgi:predicted flap endonuclease-1-like 5' DNA nuclease